MTTLKSSPDLTMVVHLISPDGRYSDVYVRNYATLQIKDQLARLPGVGQVQLFGSGDYSMRIWLDPQKLKTYDMAPATVIAAVQGQNAQISAGAFGAQPAPKAASGD